MTEKRRYEDAFEGEPPSNRPIRRDIPGPGRGEELPLGRVDPAMQVLKIHLRNRPTRVLLQLVQLVVYPAVRQPVMCSYSDGIFRGLDELVGQNT